MSRKIKGIEKIKNQHKAGKQNNLKNNYELGDKKMNYIIQDLKKLHHCLMDGDDNFIPKPIGVVAEQELKERELELLKGILYLVMNTKLTGKSTKKYIRSMESSVNKFVVYHNIKASEQDKLNTRNVSQMVDYDRKKIQELFPDKLITWVLTGRGDDLDEYEKQLNRANVKYACNRSMLNQLALDIPRAPLCETLSDDAFNDLIATIAPYTKTQMKYISDNMNKKQAGYLNYLVSAHRVNGTDLLRFNRLKELLNIDAIEPQVKEKSIDFEFEDFEDSDAIEAVDAIDETSKETVNKQPKAPSNTLKSRRIQWQ